MADNPRIEELRRRVQADPASIAFAALAEEYRRVGRYEEAVETCRVGLQRHPAYLSARVTLGRALIETGDYEAAREELETVLRAAPENLAAIRGIAQIDERLGHSTEMDPHLAEMMNTMHVESLRVAALAPVEPPPAPPEPKPQQVRQPEPPSRPSLETVLSLVPEPEPEPVITMTPQSSSPVEAAADPFAAFAPMAKQAPAHDFSVDFAQAPPPIVPVVDASPAAAPIVTPEPVLEVFPEPEVPPVVEASPVAAPIATPEPVLVSLPEPESEPELEPEPVLAREAASAERPVEGLDAGMLATLARLERFLGAIQSLRA